MNDDVLRCEYHEKIDGYKFNLIELPNEILRKKLRDFLKKYGEPEVFESGNISVVSFYDVDVAEMDRLIKRRDKYIEEFNKEINQELILKQKEEERIKVIRKNKFRKMFIKTSASLMVTLVAYAGAKTITNDINFRTPVSIPTKDITMNIDKNDEEIFSKNNEVFISNEVDNNDDLSIKEEVININNEVSDEEIEIPGISPILYEEDSLNNDIVYTEPDINYEQVFSLSADNWTDTDKFYVANAYYSEYISKMAKRYGIDPALALAIGTHERGMHSEYVDSGGAIGLFQIQVEGAWNWNNREISAYNFETGEVDTVIITKDSVSDVFENIKVGCMMIQDLLIRNNYNIAKAVTEYNYGAGNLNAVINTCSYNTGFSPDEFNNIENLEWLNYRGIIGGGDPEYLENVFKYIPNDTVLTFTKPSGEVINILYSNTRNMSNHKL